MTPERLKELAENEPGGLMAISPELLQAATDPEGWQQHVSDLLDAIRPFYDLSSGANGRIPLEKPDYADWDKLWKAYKAAKLASRRAIFDKDGWEQLTPEGVKNLERVMDPNEPSGKPTYPAQACDRIYALNTWMIAKKRPRG